MILADFAAKSSIQDERFEGALRRIRSSVVLLQSLIRHIPPALFEHGQASDGSLSATVVAREMYSASDLKSSPAFSPAVLCTRFRAAGLSSLLNSIQSCAVRSNKTGSDSEQGSDVYVKLMDVAAALAEMGSNIEVKLDWDPDAWLQAVLSFFERTDDFDVVRSTVHALVSLAGMQSTPRLAVDRRNCLRVVVGKVRFPGIS
jgi:hypothetical protein